MQGEMEDKCGIVGFHCEDESKDVASLVYYSLYALQHRGQESAGIAAFNPKNIWNDIFANTAIINTISNKSLFIRYASFYPCTS